ncbi:polymer-forming cytoskeletal protein [Candidatus Bipolaricaulota bacterium]|nr:polymer-forming cytoskeletal protein [Candidatus Bipolaricaulota bacterium]
MNQDEEEEVRVSGSGKITGGKYGKISITGSGRVEGDVEAREIFAAGSAIFEGNVKAREINVTGSCEISGYLESEEVVIKGSLNVGEIIEAKGLKSYGSLKVGKDVIGEDIYFAGSSEIEGDVEGESFVSRGSFSIGGLLTADEIDIWLGSTNSAGEVGGGRIEISKRSASLEPNPEKIKNGVESLERGLGSLGEKLGFSFELDEERISRGLTKLGERINYYVNEIGNGKFNSSLIEGDELLLEGVEAETVRGSKVRIGEDCVIDKAEYSDTIEVVENSTVNERVRI